MYFRYKVNWNFNDKIITDTGLIYTDEEGDSGFSRAMNKVVQSFDEIDSVSLSLFAPNDCLDVSSKALDEIAEHVIW